MSKRDDSNPWGLNTTGKAKQPKNSSSKQQKPLPALKKNDKINTSQLFRSESFTEAQHKHLEAAKKHLVEYESSSEEEELASDSLLGKWCFFFWFVHIFNKTLFFFCLDTVFKGYVGDKSQLDKTQQFLENIFQSGAATCLICIATVKRTDSVNK